MHLDFQVPRRLGARGEKNFYLQTFLSKKFFIK